MYVCQKLRNMKIDTYAEKYKDPNYEKLVDPVRSAVIFRDKLIRIQYKRKDEKLNRINLLVYTNDTIEKYQLKVDELKLDLADCIDQLRDLTENYKIDPEYQKRIIKTNEYLDNFANKYMDY